MYGIPHIYANVNSNKTCSLLNHNLAQDFSLCNLNSARTLLPLPLCPIVNTWGSMNRNIIPSLGSAEGLQALGLMPAMSLQILATILYWVRLRKTS